MRKTNIESVLGTKGFNKSAFFDKTKGVSYREEKRKLKGHEELAKAISSDIDYVKEILNKACDEEERKGVQLESKTKIHNFKAKMSVVTNESLWKYFPVDEMIRMGIGDALSIGGTVPKDINIGNLIKNNILILEAKVEDFKYINTAGTINHFDNLHHNILSPLIDNMSNTEEIGITKAVVSITKNKKELKIVLKNNGKGIPNSILNKYKKGQASGGLNRNSSGVGLNQAYSQTKQFGGKMDVITSTQLSTKIITKIYPPYTGDYTTIITIKIPLH